MSSRNTDGPGTATTRITAPATTPGTVPRTSSRVSGPRRVPALWCRSRAPGPATTLWSRLVGVTTGLGTPSTLTWTGGRNTAPETPTGAVATEISSPAANRAAPSAGPCAPGPASAGARCR